jgi:hypothetical protein
MKNRAPLFLAPQIDKVLGIEETGSVGLIGPGFFAPR